MVLGGGLPGEARHTVQNRHALRPVRRQVAPPMVADAQARLLAEGARGGCCKQEAFKEQARLGERRGACGEGRMGGWAWTGYGFKEAMYQYRGRTVAV